MTLAEIANTIKEDDARIILAYAFNATGKTQLCVAYKDATKLPDDSHGVMAIILPHGVLFRGGAEGGAEAERCI